MLYEFAGQLAVYGDVDRKLSRCMERMKEWVEGADFSAAQAAGAAAHEEIRAGEAMGGLFGWLLCIVLRVWMWVGTARC